MEEKIWYIFKFGTHHHQGPFSKEEIISRYHRGEFTSQTVFWKEGMKRWRPLKDCSSFASLFPQKEIVENELPPPPPSPPPPPRPPKRNAPQKEASLQPPPWIFWTGGSLIVLVSLVFFPFKIFKSEKYTPSGISPKSGRYLAQVAESSARGGTYHFRLASGENRRVLWLSSNFVGPGVVFLTLTSLAGKALSFKKVKLNAKSKIAGGYAKFSELNLISGNWPVMGEYRVQVAIYPLEGKERKVIEWEGAFTLSPTKGPKLSKRLKQWRDKHLTPLIDQHQRYKTLKSQLNKLDKFYQESLSAKTWNELAHRFESYYNMEVGPLLGRLIHDGHRLHLSFFNSNVELSQSYDKLSIYGKKIGLLAVDIASRKGGAIIEPVKSKINSELSHRFRDLELKVDRALRNIKLKMKILGQ